MGLSPQESDVRHKALLAVFGVLCAVCIAQALLLIWLWQRSPRAVGPQRESRQVRPVSPEFVRETYPQVDFTRLYPGHSDEDIAEIQRQTYGLRYVFAPYVQVKPAPATQKHVIVDNAGFRHGSGQQPWPPPRGPVVVFVYGGSTTFGLAVPDAETLPSELQRQWRTVFGEDAAVYNFGAGYYLSTQERALFEQHLSLGFRPDVAIFLDGLNDFYYYDGIPTATDFLWKCMAPDLPAPPRPSLEDAVARHRAVESVLRRLVFHSQAVETLGTRMNVRTVVVGQPVPWFLRSPQSPYPFEHTFSGHELAPLGYPFFASAAQAGAFGDRFVWAGDAFQSVREPMYVDSIHYSQAANRLLATVILERARHLLVRSR